MLEDLELLKKELGLRVLGVLVGDEASVLPFADRQWTVPDPANNDRGDRQILTELIA